ncbi:MAG: hypothetical protein OEO79_16775, partial [Gemmatimonadota bacterium]|nr:hypothetical protein [Gemmatimonadota bacterium]
DLDLPRRDEAEVPRSKIVDYLLSVAHPVGGAKARYLIARGYDPGLPEVLEKDLKAIGMTGRVESTAATDWGTKYLVVGSVQAPDGAAVEFATVWIRLGHDAPVLVTAYPWKAE